MKSENGPGRLVSVTKMLGPVACQDQNLSRGVTRWESIAGARGIGAFVANGRTLFGPDAHQQESCLIVPL